MAIYGVDISNYQGKISDLAANRDFVIIKVTEGTTYVNPYWTEQRDVARRDGKIVIYYHFSNLGAVGAELTHFLSTIGPIPATEGLALDWETGNYSDAIDAWCAAFIQGCNRPCFLYSNAARINSGAWPRVSTLHAPLWEAAYSSTSPSPSPFPVLAIWQNSSSGSEQGISGAVDEDVFNGTRDQLIQLIGGDVADKVNQDVSRILENGILGKNGLDGRPNALDGSSDGDNLVGNELTNDFITKLYQGQTASDYRDNFIPAVNKQLSDLTTQLKATNDQLTAVSTKANLSDQLQKQVADLTAQNQKLLSEQSSDTQLLNNSGNIFKQLWKRLFG